MSTKSKLIPATKLELRLKQGIITANMVFPKGEEAFVSEIIYGSVTDQRVYVNASHHPEHRSDHLLFLFPPLIGAGRHELGADSDVSLICDGHLGRWIAAAGFLKLDIATPFKYEGTFEMFRDKDSHRPAIVDGKFTFEFEPA